MTSPQDKAELKPCPDEKLPDVIKFLLGIGKLDGCDFGEFSDNGEKYKRRYWWRQALRAAWQNRATPTPDLPNNPAMRSAATIAAVIIRKGMGLDELTGYIHDMQQEAIASVATQPDAPSGEDENLVESLLMGGGLEAFLRILARRAADRDAVLEEILNKKPKTYQADAAFWLNEWEEQIRALKSNPPAMQKPDLEKLPETLPNNVIKFVMKEMRVCNEENVRRWYKTFLKAFADGIKEAAK